jgi:anti-anti-sigma regulatory factor
MKLSSMYTLLGRVVTIEADEDLDLRSHGTFLYACRLAQDADLWAIEVNLRKTRTVRDSGLAMLLMLRRRIGPEGNRIRLVNSNPDIRSRLLSSGVGAKFQIV